MDLDDSDARLPAQDDREAHNVHESARERRAARQKVNICQNETAVLVRMKTKMLREVLKTLERVKGIEPSYSAWKAAALPLSYTRAGDHLTRRAGGLNPPRRPSHPANGPVPPPAGPAALNRRRFAAYIDVSINNERR